MKTVQSYLSKNIYIRWSIYIIIVVVICSACLIPFLNTRAKIALPGAKKDISANVTSYWLSNNIQLEVVRTYGNKRYIKKMYLNTKTYHWTITFSEQNIDDNREKVTLTSFTTKEGGVTKINDPNTDKLINIKFTPTLLSMIDGLCDISTTVVEPKTDVQGNIILTEEQQEFLIKLANSIHYSYAK